MVAKDAYFDKTKRTHEIRARIHCLGDNKNHRTPKHTALHCGGFAKQLLKLVFFYITRNYDGSKRCIF